MTDVKALVTGAESAAQTESSWSACTTLSLDAKTAFWLALARRSLMLDAFQQAQRGDVGKVGFGGRLVQED